MKRTTPSASATTWRAPKIDHQLLIGRHDEILPIHAGGATAFRYHRMPPMAASTDTSTTLDLTSRAAEGSRSARRLRRTGQVPGVIYGGDGDAELFAVDGRILRNTLARSGAILQISVDGAAPGPVLVKDIQRHPVRGEAMHVDFLRVDMTQTIQTTVVLELVGNESAPGVVEGGVLSQGAIELNIEALPGDIPDGIQFDVSTMEMNATATLAELTPPAGVTLLDDPDETVLATITPPSQEPAEDEIETETEVVGEGEAAAEGEARPRAGRGRVLGRVLKLFSSAPVDWLVVGLGNPGPGYANTPHNVGFLVADALIARWDLPKPKKKFAGELTEGRTGPGGPRVAVLKPQTFMNDAGRSVGPARGSFKLDLDRVLVVHDEIDLPFGDIRVRLGGGLAGHNGLKSLKRELGSADFNRVRVGVGRPDSTDPEIVSAHVLGKWRQSAGEVRELVERARDEAEALILRT